VLGVDLAVADADEELLLAADLDGLEDLLELAVVLEELVERHAPLVELALEELAPETERLVALLEAEKVPDLRAGARGADEVEPVLVRAAGWSTS